MQGKRLRVDAPEDDGGNVIPAVPAPVQGVGRAHSLAQVLELALATAGLQVSYDALMGLSGLAFRTPPWPDPPALSADEALAAFNALNQALDPPLVIRGADDPLSPDDALELVATQVDEGRPCIALGWGSVKDRWSIIAGYDRAKARLLGHCVLDAPRQAYESWPPEMRLLVMMPPNVAIAHRSAFLAAVESAHRRWASEGRARYDRWIAALNEHEREPDSTQEAAVALLADARGAAAVFLSRLAEGLEGNRGAWIARAAEIYERFLEMLEGRGTAPLSEAALVGLKDPAWRAAWAERLAQMAELEDEAAAALRRSSSAELPPEEILEP